MLQLDFPLAFALDVLLLVLMCVVMVIAPIALLRMVRAKTQSSYFKNMALFAIPILVVFALGKLAGISDGPNAPQSVTALVPAHKPTATGTQLVFLALAGGTWLGGGSLLWLRHIKRVGRSWWSAMNPLQPPFKDFNAKEWTILAALVVVSLSFAALSINAGGAT